jgi:hypothetical protein
MSGNASDRLVQRQSIPWRVSVAGALLLAATTAMPPVGSAADAMAALRDSPAFLDLFASRLHRDAYRSFVASESLDDLLREIAGDRRSGRAPGSWTASPVSPFDAFGDTGSYDRFRLARLYGSTRPRVARGPRLDDEGQTVESWTLISPYPDPALSRLLPGTLVIVLRMPER